RSDPSACRIPSIPSVYLSIGHGFGAPDLTCVPSTGTMHTSTIFVDFPDQHAGNDTTSSLYSFFFPAASEWYSTSSFGKLSLDAKADTSRFYRMPKNASAYEWNRGITSEQHQSYIQDALDSYSSFNGVDLAPADALYVIASRNSPAITYSPTFMGTVTTRNGTFVANKAVTVGYDAYKTWGYKLINHETGHVMCLADLYPASGAVGMYVGDYDVMGNINAVYPDYFAWDKWRLGWLEDAQVACLADGVGGGNASVSSYVVGPVERAGEETKAVVVKKNETQAMVVEVRAGAGVDDKGGKPGVVVYTVDTTVETLQGPIRVLTEEP
ncbi:M6 metalloprotease, partial [Bimuria novae-zelandiae CBS 107.79]